MKAALISALATAASAKLYIAKLKPSIIDDVAGAFPDLTIQQTWNINNGEFQAFATDVEDPATIAGDAIEYVVENQDFFLSAALPAPSTAAVDSWGLDRVDQRDLPLDDSYTAPGRQGAGVTVYVIDSGVEDDHPEFGGRARFGFNGAGGSNADAIGHGTHVAGTVAAESFGVAPRADVVSVKVCGGRSCALNAILSGVEWAANDRGNSKAVGNMSLGGRSNAAIDDAVTAAINSGLAIAVASGNDNRDACGYSPARVPTAVTVNASTINDGKASFSNFGSCTDLYAPGEGITSTWLNGSTNTISGTSMASPHVAGVMALLLAERDYTPAELHDAVLEFATPNRISNPRGTNLLLFSEAEASGEQPEEPEEPTEPVPENPLCAIFPIFC